MKYEIKNRWTNKAQFTAEVDCEEGKPESWKIGLAVRWAIKTSADLSGADLSGAYLRGANLSGANLSGTDLRGANLSGADLSGADLSGAYLRGANLSGANLSGTDLRGANLSGANLSGTDLRGTDLRGANLSGANLSGTDLRGANLSGADLSGTDLRGAYLRGANLSGADLSGTDLRGAYLSGASFGKAPKIKNIHSAIYEATKADNALDMSKWHTCDTTHCCAGWVVHLAGLEGYELEAKIGTPAAAAAIYMASDPDLEKIPDFYADNETALADMKRLAELEAA